MKQKVFYKIVKIVYKDNGPCLYSYVFSLQKYKENEWVGRMENYGPLAVFDSLKSACDFISKDIGHMYRNTKIYTCHIKPSSESDLYYPRLLGGVVCSYAYRGKDLPLPTGTVLADKVKLLTQVSKEEIIECCPQLFSFLKT